VQARPTTGHEDSIRLGALVSQKESRKARRAWGPATPPPRVERDRDTPPHRNDWASVRCSPPTGLKRPLQSFGRGLQSLSAMPLRPSRAPVPRPMRTKNDKKIIQCSPADSFGTKCPAGGDPRPKCPGGGRWKKLGRRAKQVEQPAADGPSRTRPNCERPFGRLCGRLSASDESKGALQSDPTRKAQDPVTTRTMTTETPT